MAGVTATGFSVKTLAEIKTEIDAALVQGVRLDQLGSFRRIDRLANESDDAYRARLLQQQDQTQTAVAALQAALTDVAGVTNVQIYYNTSGISNQRGQQALTASIIVEGGSDIDVANTIANNLVFGLGLLGNTSINIDDNGLCRTIRFIRPEIVQFTIDVTTSAVQSIGSCGGTSVANVKDILTTTFAEQFSRPNLLITSEYLKARLLADGIGVASLTMFDGSVDQVQLTSSELATLSVDSW